MGKLGVSIKLLTEAKYCRTREAYSDRSDPTCTFKDTDSAASVIAARLCRVRAACQAEQANKAENLSALDKDFFVVPQRLSIFYSSSCSVELVNAERT
jgi:hypothetical protein